MARRCCSDGASHRTRRSEARSGHDAPRMPTAEGKIVVDSARRYTCGGDRACHAGHASTHGHNAFLWRLIAAVHGASDGKGRARSRGSQPRGSPSIAGVQPACTPIAFVESCIGNSCAPQIAIAMGLPAMYWSFRNRAVRCLNGLGKDVCGAAVWIPRRRVQQPTIHSASWSMLRLPRLARHPCTRRPHVMLRDGSCTRVRELPGTVDRAEW
jgi:hypothetical protein